MITAVICYVICLIPTHQESAFILAKIQAMGWIFQFCRWERLVRCRSSYRALQRSGLATPCLAARGEHEILRWIIGILESRQECAMCSSVHQR